jgi:hypothetical protein
VKRPRFFKKCRATGGEGEEEDYYGFSHEPSPLTRGSVCEPLGESVNIVQNNLSIIITIYQICIYTTYKASCQSRICKTDYALPF